MVVRGGFPMLVPAIMSKCLRLLIQLIQPRGLFHKKQFFYACLVLLIICGSSFGICENVPNEQDAEFFERKIRPLLVKKCYACHSREKEESGGLLLDSKPGWQRGGDSGLVIVPGDPDGSRLIKAVRWKTSDLLMPPQDAGGRLQDAEITDLETWIRSGAFDPRTEEPPVIPRKAWAQEFQERREWWSLQPIVSPQEPLISESLWNTSPIDRFVLDRMVREGLTPSSLENPETLLRRATLVLTGLPPSFEQTVAFGNLFRRDGIVAFVAEVDRLMASPAYGERMARHWLDVVRFTETHGNEWNYDFSNAWRYRDYCIRAFNDDVPYDQFVREHIAGDLLENPRHNDLDNVNESVIATAFYRCGEVNHDSCVDFGVIGYDIVDNQLDTLTKAFLSTTVACARCHDHKMDAVSTKDYHGLLGILRSSRSVQHTLDMPHVNQSQIDSIRSIKSHLRSALVQQWRQDLITLDAAWLTSAVTALGDKAPEMTDPLFVWHRLLASQSESGQKYADTWLGVSAECESEIKRRAAFNAENFVTIADFRKTLPEGWITTGMGLREGVCAAGNFLPADDGDSAIRRILPAGLHTSTISEKLNGALRSPTLLRTKAKVSFEVIGGGNSLSRLVFHNCQLNYNHQHSIHHPEWSWITIEFPEKTESLRPYAELLTFWDNPKFPDPLGTLGKDTENQRQPYDEHVKNPKTWWGLRRIVAHDVSETPKDEAGFVHTLLSAPPPQSAQELVAKYAEAGRSAIEAFGSHHATDQDVQWLNWMLARGLLTNRAQQPTQPKGISASDKTDAADAIAALVTQYRDVQSQLSLPRTMPGFADEEEGISQPLLIRGEYTKPGELIARAYPEALASLEKSSERSQVPIVGSGRMMVANAISSRDNPLTSRVMVNRLWQWIFGEGLVRTPDDFGHVGMKPTHPELLDHLAQKFVADNWSIKSAIRSMILSRAFCLSSVPNDKSRQQDPDNFFLTRYSARRAEAEVIRDSLLFVSGRLDKTLYGASVHPHRVTSDNDKRLFVGPLDGHGRRSLYIKSQLMEPPQFLSAFNLPGGKVTQGRRDTSNVPSQSLAMLNDPFVHAMAHAWARLVLEDTSTTVDQRLTQMVNRSLGRSPRESELRRLSKATNDFATIHQVESNDILKDQQVWTDVAHMIYNFKEFIFIP